ncbi:zinc finger MYM-type protein 1-like [Tachypleus tridentatus]|uniref:zinc finger MYM-type protein 1-like n=1 Tax=Tachypleus tridentatus TaxID=6853 RepID=UPI003FD484D8
MQHNLLPKKRQREDGPKKTCGASEEDSRDRDSENADTTSAGPQPQEITTHPQGFWNWKKATTSLKSHDNSAVHKFSMQAWVEFKLQKTKNARIQHALDASYAKIVEENRHYIRAVIDALLYTACQNEAQRGHREGSQSDNRVNFLELLDMISRYDEIVKKKLSGPGNAKYTHHDIQNELLDILAEMIRKDISKEVMEAEHFALMLDETKDVSKQEQLSIMGRYLHQQSLHEEFLDFTAGEGLDSLFKKIMETG